MKPAVLSLYGDGGGGRWRGRCPLAAAAFLACLAAICTAQAAGEGRLQGATEEFVVHAWETKDGLPDSSATSMAQTPDGYLWVGTFNGLARFNGHEMKVFDRFNTPELPSPAVVSVHVDKAGRLWVGDRPGRGLPGRQWQVVADWPRAGVDWQLCPQFCRG